MGWEDGQDPLAAVGKNPAGNLGGFLGGNHVTYMAGSTGVGQWPDPWRSDGYYSLNRVAVGERNDIEMI